MLFQYLTAMGCVRDNGNSPAYAAAWKGEFRAKYDSGRVYALDQVYRRMEAFLVLLVLHSYKVGLVPVTGSPSGRFVLHSWRSSHRASQSSPLPYLHRY